MKKGSKVLLIIQGLSLYPIYVNHLIRNKRVPSIWVMITGVVRIPHAQCYAMGSFSFRWISFSNCFSLLSKHLWNSPLVWTSPGMLYWSSSISVYSELKWRWLIPINENVIKCLLTTQVSGYFICWYVKNFYCLQNNRKAISSCQFYRPI